MKQENFSKPIKKTRPQALERCSGQKEPVKASLSKEELSRTIWGRFTIFCNESYKKLTPKSPDNRYSQEELVIVQKKCLELLEKNDHLEDWDVLLKKLPDKDYQKAEKFYFYLSRKYSDSPKEFMKKWHTKLEDFVVLSEYALEKQENRDLLKIGEFGNIIDNFNNSGERTFFFLSRLPFYLSLEDRNILESSVGYQQIISWGASQYLNNFGLQLQKYFRITRTAIKDEAAQNLAQELGEMGINLKTQIQILEREKQELEEKIEQIKSDSFEEAVSDLARAFQNQGQPLLDQIFYLHKHLNELNEQGENLSSDSLKYLITFEALLECFKEINITFFPTNPKQTFEINGEQLSEYSYESGSAFADKTDTKIVHCICPGWVVGNKIISPAKVEEVTLEN